MSEGDGLARSYPALFGPLDWGIVHVAGFTQTATVPDRSLIQSVNVVPFVADRCVVIQAVDGSLMLPGGTRVPGESLLDTARRELMEEAGGEIDAARPFGYWFCHSRRTEPWRAYLPHPDYLRLVVVAEARLVRLPTNPEVGERIARVDLVAVPEAVNRFAESNQPELADLYALAAQLRKRSRPAQESQAAFDAAMSAH